MDDIDMVWHGQLPQIEMPRTSTNYFWNLAKPQDSTTLRLHHWWPAEGQGRHVFFFKVTWHVLGSSWIPRDSEWNKRRPFQFIDLTGPKKHWPVISSASSHHTEQLLRSTLRRPWSDWRRAAEYLLAPARWNDEKSLELNVPGPWKVEPYKKWYFCTSF
jgi:hypothetical protein